MSYAVVYTQDCYPDFTRLDKAVLKKLKNTIEARLASSPEIYGKPLRYSKKGLWSLRNGDYRVIYRIVDNKVWILRLGHRKEVYD